MAEQDPIARFDGKMISYSYDNGWSFTNTFDGNLRITETSGRGVLREHIEMAELRPDLYFAAWIGDEMGPIAQIIDLETGNILAAIAAGDAGTQILKGKLINVD